MTFADEKGTFEKLNDRLDKQEHVLQVIIYLITFTNGGVGQGLFRVRHKFRIDETVISIL